MIAMQIFTADVMEKIVDIYESDVFKKQKRFPEILIKNNTIFVRVKTSNFLESKYKKKLLDYDKIKDEYELIEAIIELLEIFTNKLNEILG